VWDVTITGFIPVGTAGIGGAALYLDFAATTSLDPRITFSRTTNATVTGSNGLIQNAPMNLLTFSEQFDNAAWTKTNATVTANTTVAPNGATTADTITFSATGNVSQGTNLAVSAGQTLTGSMYVKGIAGQTFRAYVQTGGGTYQASLITVTFTGDWQRVTVPALTLSDAKSLVFLVVDNAGGSTASALNIWGAQLELGSTATTYNPTTVKNLLGFTENFDNAAWTKSNASISATKVDDIYGQPFAQKLVENTANNVHYAAASATTLNGSHAFSVYIKPAGRNFAAIECTGRFAYFDLVNGTVGTQTNATGFIQAVGDGWYRCSIVFTSTAGANSFIIYTSTTAAAGGVTYTGDGTSGIYIFGAQLSDSASVDPYVYQPVAAPTSTAYYGPRFDYDPVTLAPKGLLIEEQRTNLLLQSQTFETTWIASDVSITANATIAPDGTVTADKLVENSVNTAHNLVQAVTTTAASHVFSVYAKASERNFIVLYNLTAVVAQCFDLTTGTVGASTGSPTSTITPVGNGWYRCTMAHTATAASNSFRIYLATSNTVSVAYAGNGTSGLFIWGAQLEAGAFATSYIPTVASQVTRAADNASMIGNNFARWYNQTEGTICEYANFSGIRTTGTDYGLLINATLDDTIALGITDGNYLARVRVNSTDQALFGGASMTGGGSFSRAVAYKANDFATSLNGGTVSTDSSGAVPVGVSLLITSGFLGTSPVNRTISRISYYPRRLANTELQGITS
jgi:hypothetical protein